MCQTTTAGAAACAAMHTAAPRNGAAAAHLLRSVLMQRVTCDHCSTSTEPPSLAQKCAGEAAAEATAAAGKPAPRASGPKRRRHQNDAVPPDEEVRHHSLGGLRCACCPVSTRSSTRRRAGRVQAETCRISFQADLPIIGAWPHHRTESPLKVPLHVTFSG